MRDNQGILRDFIKQVWNVGDLDAVETFVAPESSSVGASQRWPALIQVVLQVSLGLSGILRRASNSVPRQGLEPRTY